MFKKLTVCLLACYLFTICQSHPTFAENTRLHTAPQEQIKAAFIFKFLLFVDWPKNNFPQADSPIKIGVVGEKKFADILKTIVGKRKANGKSVSIKLFKKQDNFFHTHLLYVGSPTDEVLDRIISKVANKPILTIGDAPGLAQKGVMINFIKKDNRVWFEVNIDALSRAGITISSKVLQLAKVVRERVKNND